jgi:hypothetical protein
MDFIEPGVQVCGDMPVLFYRFLSSWLNTDGSVLKRAPWNCTEVYQRCMGAGRSSITIGHISAEKDIDVTQRRLGCAG